jgi:hypothetical protein
VPLQLDDRTATLAGVVTVDDTEAFVAWLRSTTGPLVDLRDCTRLHTAVFQAILAFEPTVTVGPTDNFLAAYVLPMLRTGRATAYATTEADDDDDGDAGR